VGGKLKKKEKDIGRECVRACVWNRKRAPKSARHRERKTKRVRDKEKARLIGREGNMTTKERGRKREKEKETGRKNA